MPEFNLDDDIFIYDPIAGVCPFEHHWRLEDHFERIKPIIELLVEHMFTSVAEDMERIRDERNRGPDWQCYCYQCCNGKTEEEASLARIEGIIDELMKTTEINKKHQQKVDDLMKMSMESDFASSRLFGMLHGEWIGYCESGGCPEGCDMHQDLKDVDCTERNMNAACMGRERCNALMKRRKIVDHFSDRVDQRVIDSLKRFNN
jgi:hypothetical protein